jgi:hypothetical protein
MKKAIIIFILSILVSYFAKAQQERDSIIKIFHTVIKLNNDFLESLKRNDSTFGYKERRIVEKYSEDYYDSILPRFVDITCKTKDSELLFEFLKVLIANQNSADEEPYYQYVQIYLRQPDFTLKSINKFKDRNLALNLLNDGFQIFPIAEKKQIKNYQQLEEQLQTVIKNKR